MIKYWHRQPVSIIWLMQSQIAMFMGTQMGPMNLAIRDVLYIRVRAASVSFICLGLLYRQYVYEDVFMLHITIKNFSEWVYDYEMHMVICGGSCGLCGRYFVMQLPTATLCFVVVVEIQYMSLMNYRQTNRSYQSNIYFVSKNYVLSCIKKNVITFLLCTVMKRQHNKVIQTINKLIAKIR